MAQLYARDPSLWEILTGLRATLRTHSGELRTYTAVLTLLTGSQNEYVKSALHLVYTNAQHAIAGIFR